MKHAHTIIVCTPLIVTTWVSVFAQQVKTDFDHQANFSQYKTYSWQEIKPEDSLWDARIKNAVDAELASKGWTRVDTNGDVAIVAIKTTQTEKTLQTFYDGFGGGWRWRGFGGFGRWECPLPSTSPASRAACSRSTATTGPTPIRRLVP